MCSPGPGLVLAVSRLRWILLQTVCLTSDSGSRVSLSCLLFPGGAWHAGPCAQGPGLLGGLPSVLLAKLCLPETQPWVPSCQFHRLSLCGTLETVLMPTQCFFILAQP